MSAAQSDSHHLPISCWAESCEGEEAGTWPAAVRARHCCLASISFHMFHFYFSLYLCLRLGCMANGCSLVPSQRRDSAPAITANPPHFSRRQPLRKKKEAQVI